MNQRAASFPAPITLPSHQAAAKTESHVEQRASMRWPIRCLRAIAISMAYLVAYAVARVRTREEERPNLAGLYLTKYLTRMGPLWIKLGQVLATRGDLIAEELITQLRQLHDDCPPSSAAYVRRKLQEIYGPALAETFTDFDFVPLASGSIAQVHQAVLAGGEKVAVKIIKQGVRSALSDDLIVARLLIRVSHFLLPAVRRLDLVKHFHEISILLASQADLALELQRQNALRERFTGHPFVHVPTPYPNLSNEDILVMELIEEIPGRNWKQVKISPQLLARRVQHVVYTMLYHKGIFHADPHPGNVFFTSNGKMIMVDFGIVGFISEDEKWGLSSFFYACVRKDWDRAVKRFFRFFVEPGMEPSAIPRDLEREFAAVLRHHFEERNQRWSTVGFLNDGRRVLQRHNLRFTTNFTQVAFMFFTGEGFISQIDPEIDIWLNARMFTDRASPYMSEELTKRFDRDLWEQRPASHKLRLRAARTLVAPTHLDRYILPSRYPLFIRRAFGSKLEDVDGNVLIDLSGGYGPHILGYSHPVVVDAIAAAAADGGINALAHEAEVLLAEDLVSALSGSDLAVLCNSGTESVIQAVRLCRTARGKDRVAKFEGHYHGFSDQGVVSSWVRFSGSQTQPRPIAPPGVSPSTIDNTIILQYGFEESLAVLRQNAADLACVICEPMPAGLAAYDTRFLQQLRACCDELNLPLVFDEVVSGFRVAYGGVQTRTKVTPDLTCLGKIIGGGLPCGAVVGRREIVELAKSSEDPYVDYESKTFVGGTMSGNKIVCSAGHAVLTYLQSHPEVYDDLEAKTDWLVKRLTEIARSQNVSFFINGTCSIFSLRFADNAAAHTVREHQLGSYFKANLALAYYMRKHNVYLPELHTIMLSAAHSYDDLETVASAFSASLREMVQDGFFVF